MKKKLLSIVLCTVMAASVMAGCGSTDNSEQKIADSVTEKGTDKTNVSDTSGKSENEKITLRFAWWGGDERNAATQEVIEQFEELHPNVEIEAEYGGNDGYHDKLATQLASGTAADIVQVDPEIFPSYVNNGDYFYDYAEYGMDMSNFEEAYISLPINGRYDGKQLGLPSGISGAGILVNKDLADEIGIDFTQSIDWEMLLEMGKKVREYDNETYLLCANKEYIANLVVFNYGKQLIGNTFFNDETGKLNITKENLDEIYGYVQKLYDEEVVAPASYQAAYSGDNLPSDVNWIGGKYVAALTYVSTIDVMIAANPNADYYMSQLPKLEGCTETGWASNTPQVFAITKSCEYPEMAVEFMNYFFNDETAIKTLGCTRSVPPTEKARQICTDNDVLSECTMEGANIAAAMGGTPNDKISSSEEVKALLFDTVETIGYGANDENTIADMYSLLEGMN